MDEAAGQTCDQVGRPWWRRPLWLVSLTVLILSATGVGAMYLQRSETDRCAGAFEEQACRFQAEFDRDCPQDGVDEWARCMERLGYFDQLTPRTQTWVREMDAGPLHNSEWTSFAIKQFADRRTNFFCEVDFDSSPDESVLWGRQQVEDQTLKHLIVSKSMAPTDADWWIAEARQHACPEQLTERNRQVLNRVYSKEFRPNRPSSPAPRTLAPAPAESPPAPAEVPLLPVSGADARGFLAGGPRCSDSERAELLMRTSGSLIAICRAQNGGLFYRGVRESDGAGIELESVKQVEGGFAAINTDDATQYRVDERGLTISSDGQIVASEPIVEVAFL